VSYRARYAPEQDESFDAILMDSEGLAASELLSNAGVLEENDPDMPLAQDLMEADALVLTVNAAGEQHQLDADFSAFKNLLRIVQERRGDSADVGGLPVFLVLTHADRLAHATDSLADWIDRLEERKHEIDRQFRAVLEQEESHPPEAGDDPEEAPAHEDAPEPEFGWIDLRVWATATERPRLRGEGSAGAYGVADLFRQCLAEAADYRRDLRKSEGRLRGLVLLISLLALLLLGLAGTRLATDVDGRTALLASHVEDLRSSYGSTPKEYLHGTLEQLREQEERLREIQADPRFSRLSTEQQSFVADGWPRCRAT
jgi:hypothetical protein